MIYNVESVRKKTTAIVIYHEADEVLVLTVGGMNSLQFTLDITTSVNVGTLTPTSGISANLDK